MAAINWVGQTNQRLYQCRLMLEQVELAVNHALATALEDGAVLQLGAAYRCYLNELAGLVNVNGKVNDLSELFAKAAFAIADMQELQQLEADIYGWLGQLKQMLRDAQQLAAVSKPSSVEQVEPSGNLIASAPAEQSRAEILQGILGELQALIECQRGNHKES